MTVIEYEPVPVVEAAVSVMVDDPAPGALIDVGLKLAVTPFGMPDADNVIVELKPPETVVVMVAVPLDPGETETEEVGAEIEKAGGAVTVKVTVAVCVTPPSVPVTVIGYEPVAVVEPTVMVMVEVPEPEMDEGAKLTVTPAG